MPASYFLFRTEWPFFRALKLNAWNSLTTHSSFPSTVKFGNFLLKIYSLLALELIPLLLVIFFVLSKTDIDSLVLSLIEYDKFRFPTFILALVLVRTWFYLLYSSTYNKF